MNWIQGKGASHDTSTVGGDTVPLRGQRICGGYAAEGTAGRGAGSDLDRLVYRRQRRWRLGLRQTERRRRRARFVFRWSERPGRGRGRVQGLSYVGRIGRRAGRL